MKSKVEVAAKREKVARGVAMGLEVVEAGIAAGYSKRGSETRKIVRKPAFMKRVKVLEDLFLWTGSCEPAPLIMELRATARKAVGLGSGAGMNAAAAMYAEIGRLTTKLASRPAGQDDGLTDAEWLEIHGPPS
jgi:hypothetical protein